jgi:hypothetical protein
LDSQEILENRTMVPPFGRLNWQLVPAFDVRVGSDTQKRFDDSLVAILATDVKKGLSLLIFAI